MLRRSVCIQALAVAMVSIALLSPGVMVSAQQAPPAAVDVKIDNFSFGPATVTVSRGDHRDVD